MHLQDVTPFNSYRVSVTIHTDHPTHRLSDFNTHLTKKYYIFEKKLPVKFVTTWTISTKSPKQQI